MKHFLHTVFANDTSIFYANDYLNNLNIVNSELSSLNAWFKANKLLLNIRKTDNTLFNTY